MYFKRIARRAFVFTVTGFAIAAALPASASQAAVTPPWRLIKTIGPNDGDASVSFTAAPHNAWMTWTAIGLDNKQHDAVLHWTGRTWQNVPVPASFDNYVQAALGIVAPTAKDVWVFNSFNHSKALRWNGSKWTLQSIPSWVVRFSRSGDFFASPVAFSPTNIWVFSSGLTSSAARLAAHYNGHTWAKMTLPIFMSSVSAVSSNDIWLMGDSVTNPSRFLLAHWNGSKWSTVALPKVTIPKGAAEFVGAFTALGPANVWAIWNIIQGSAGAVTMYLLHWNGKSWARVHIKFPTSWAAGLAPDGQGGLWVSASGSKSENYMSHFYHLINGHQFQYTYPTAGSTNPATLVWIPGTRSMWAYHDIEPSSTTVSTTILKYGP